MPLACGTGVLTLFTATIFLGAGLLFLVQPLFARMVLPLLGGAPAVWNTAMVFYQATLLAGYAYAHVGIARLGIRRVIPLHLVVLALPLLVLPVGIPGGWTPPGEAHPTPWLLALLAVAVGLPFFAVSTTSPLLQAWFARLGHGAAGDPYFLYAASNLGSMLALLSYPVLLEPLLTLPAQSRLWAAGYGLLALLVAACALVLRRAPGAAIAGLQTDAPSGAGGSPAGIGSGAPTLGRRLRWLLLALVPSSMMLSVTTYLSSDIAAIPLLWIIPLSIYLLTFILVFARRSLVPHRLMVELLPLVMLPVVMVLASGANEPLGLVIGTHLVAFFVAGMVCHGALALDRPEARHLTGFYLWLSAGGVLGGAFTALAAPLLFTRIVEYPLMLVLACVLARRPDAGAQRRAALVLDVLAPVAVGAIGIAAIRAVQAGVGGMDSSAIGPVVGGLALLCLGFARRPVRFGLGIGAVLIASTFHQGVEGRLLHAERSFFGVHRVTLDPAGRYHVLLHGTTLHGMQSLEPARRREPLTYFYPTGPLGQVFDGLRGPAAKQSVAVVGLGAGSVSCYAEPGQRWTFYEIDPAVARIARDPRYFTFLDQCLPAARIVLGDARLSLARAGPGAYELIILDAYSSDAPPLHLLTREAFALYLDKLDPAGLIALNISNRHLDLEPVVGAVARAAGLASLTRDDPAIGDAEWALGKRPSHWVLLAREPALLGALRDDPRWKPPATPPGAVAWTDNFSSLLSALRRGS
jgi:hypothetical protein